jgi:hypothetical protein
MENRNNLLETEEKLHDYRFFVKLIIATYFFIIYIAIALKYEASITITLIN